MSAVQLRKKPREERERERERERGERDTGEGDLQFRTVAHFKEHLTAVPGTPLSLGPPAVGAEVIGSLRNEQDAEKFPRSAGGARRAESGPVSREDAAARKPAANSEATRHNSSTLAVFEMRPLNPQSGWRLT